MQVEGTDQTLSISERAYSIAKQLRSLGNLLRDLLIFNLFFLSLGWANLIYHFAPPNLISVFVYLELTIATIAILVYFLFRGPNAYKNLKQWNEDYLEQAYILVFDTTIPKGDTTGEKVLNLARAIFPELRSGYTPIDASVYSRIKLYLKRKFGKSEQIIISESMDYKISPEDSVDLALTTPEGYFIVKDFKDKVVTFEELKHLVNILSRKFRSIPHKTNIFRVICIAKGYDESILNMETVEKLMTTELKANFKIDLILEEKVGYSVLWVS